jgi:lipopolysaccharide biosynthesis glycosyltransferase
MPMKNRLIVTIMVGNDPSFYFVKKSFNDYAKKVKADFLCLTENRSLLQSKQRSKMLEALFIKICLGDLSKDYERVLYLDADILVTPHAKNIFDEYPNKNYLYMLNEGATSDRQKELNLISSRLKTPINDTNYFNAGVILFSQKLEFLQAIRIHDLDYFKKNTSWFDQTYINFKIRFNNLQAHSITQDFNRMGNREDAGRRYSADFIHYSGNGYCPKKYRPLLIFRDYCKLYSYKPNLIEKVTFTIQFTYMQILRLLNKFLFTN